MKKKGKLILINLLVFIVLLASLEFLSSILLDARHNYVLSHLAPISLAHLPNYDTFAWATQHFEEFASLKSEYRSYYGWRKLPFEGETIHIDSFGIRKTIQSYATDTLPTIAFLGGSTMWGTGVSDAFTIPSCFAQQTNSRYQVLNYGEVGYSALQSFIFLQLKILEGIQPSLVISYDGVNNSPAHLPRFYGHAREEQIIHILKEVDTGFEDYPYFLISTRQLIQKMKGYVNKDLYSPLPQVYSQERNRQAARELLESWLLMQKLCEENEIEFVAILQPNAFVGQPNTENIQSSLDTNTRLHGYDYYSHVHRLLKTKKYEALLDNFLDLSHAYDRMPNVYIDFCHVSPNGNHHIANLIKDFLKSP